jgi:alkylation response protein AidB-like acyl-CoA dehydrogenase
MDFEFSKDQNLIRQSAKEFFEKECPRDRTRELLADKKGYDPKMWKKMVQLGFAGLIIDERYGGTQGEFLELAILMEEMGRNIVPCPYFSTVCLCAPAIQQFGSDAHKKKFLPKIAEKGEIWSLALNEKRTNYEAEDIQLSAPVEKDAFILNGTKLFVPYANAAKHLLVAARTSPNETAQEGITVFMVDAKSPGIEIEEIPTAAPGVKCQVRFNSVGVSRENILGEIDRGWDVLEHIIQYGAVLKSAEMAGGTQAALDMAVKYARERIQFDKPIASFQVIQHKLVNMFSEMEGLRNQVYEAAWSISAGTPSRALSSMVKVKANSVYHRVCFDAVVIHGAIGWTAEMDVSLYLLRSKDLENDCGGSDFHKERIARELEQHDPAFLMMEEML